MNQWFTFLRPGQFQRSQDDFRDSRSNVTGFDMGRPELPHAERALLRVGRARKALEKRLYDFYMTCSHPIRLSVKRRQSQTRE